MTHRQHPSHRPSTRHRDPPSPRFPHASAAANDRAGETGDWSPMAEFYTDDATYGWNIGPKEDVIILNKPFLNSSTFF